MIRRISTVLPEPRCELSTVIHNLRAVVCRHSHGQLQFAGTRRINAGRDGPQMSMTGWFQDVVELFAVLNRPSAR